MRLSIFSILKKITCGVSLFFYFATTSFAASPIIMGYWESWGTYHGFSMPGSTQPNEIMRGQLTGLNAVTYSLLEVNPKTPLAI